MDPGPATHLVDRRMACSCSNVGEIELAEVQLAHRALSRRHRVPIDLDGLAEVEMGWEDARLLHLGPQRQREARVGGEGDVGALDVELRRMERMVGNGVQHGNQGDGQGDEEDGWCEEETAEAELLAQVLVLVRRAARV